MSCKSGHAKCMLSRVLFQRAGKQLYSTSITPRWQSLQTLDNGEMESFRQRSFEASIPCMMPRGSFDKLPAITKWFHTIPNSGGVCSMNSEYLDRYGHSMVPIEYTLIPSKSTSEDSEGVFMRSNVPLSLFLEWTKQAEANTLDRLYLAQASLADLPKGLVEDLPVPDFVKMTGKGDIYDANLWIGISPTYTPLHQDPNPNLFVQIAGQKIVRIMEPETGRKLFEGVQEALGRDGSAAFRNEEMMKGKEKSMLENLIWDDQAKLSEYAINGYEAHVGQGDGVFIPNGWWHSIKGVGEGITGSVNWWFR